MDMCFQHKTVSKLEVLAVVMQQLVDHNPTPELTMRTVLKSLELAPTLVKYVKETILKKLIEKSVWESKRVWEGFVKCLRVNFFFIYFFLLVFFSF